MMIEANYDKFNILYGCAVDLSLLSAHTLLKYPTLCLLFFSSLLDRSLSTSSKVTPLL